MASEEIEHAIDDLILTARHQGGEQRQSLWRGDESALAEAFRLDGELATQRAALIALLARDDARIARLERVVIAAKDAVTPELFNVDREWPESSGRKRLMDALALLDDADAPGTTDQAGGEK